MAKVTFQFEDSSAPDFELGYVSMAIDMDILPQDGDGLTDAVLNALGHGMEDALATATGHSPILAHIYVPQADREVTVTP